LGFGVWGLGFVIPRSQITNLIPYTLQHEPPALNSKPHVQAILPGKKIASVQVRVCARVCLCVYVCACVLLCLLARVSVSLPFAFARLCLPALPCSPHSFFPSSFTHAINSFPPPSPTPLTLSLLLHPRHSLSPSSFTQAVSDKSHGFMYLVRPTLRPPPLHSPPPTPSPPHSPPGVRGRTQGHLLPHLHVLPVAGRHRHRHS